MRRKHVLLIICLAVFIVVLSTNQKGHLGKQLLSENYNVSRTWFGFENEAFEVKGSKYILTNELRGEYVDSVPRALAYITDEAEKVNQKKSFGVSAAWARKGYNWVDVIPAANHSQYLKPFPGTVKSIDLWVWGANYDYDFHMLFENSDKYVYNMKVRSLKFLGWKSLSLKIPSALMVATTHRYIPRKNSLIFKNFRIYTKPLERVNQFNIFLDNMRITTDIYEGEFDGIEIERILKKRIDGNDANGQPKQPPAN